LYLIVEVDDESQVLAFLAPFESGKQRGHLPSLDVRRGSRQRQLRGADAGSVNLCQLWIPQKLAKTRLSRASCSIKQVH
jgi:hypothetical protein